MLTGQVYDATRLRIDRANHMKKFEIQHPHIVIFLISLVCISQELFLTRILNLKAWNHVVYTVIPFAMLGYGIGSNIVLVFNDFFRKFQKERVLAIFLLLIAISTFGTALILKDIPIKVEYILSIFTSIQAIGMLLLAYTLFMIPFVFIGFLIVYLFSNSPEDVHKLYFFDLLGAGLGAYLFFPFINHFAVFHSLAIFSAICVFTAIWLMASRLKGVLFVSCLLLFLFNFFTLAEPSGYVIDPRKGWEWIPGYFPKTDYEHLVSRWHPLGRTDVYRMKGKSGGLIYQSNPGTFEINLNPLPEISYFSTNFLAGTPVYAMSKAGLERNHSEIKLFTQRMEVPYTLLTKPKVLVIGAGGGRDIFMAHTHGAQSIIGAEINPGIVAEMSPGGRMYDYSGRIYTSENTRVYSVDGRYLVKTLPSNSMDLIVLNGVDTFSGLSSGAYAYAESYLYTKNAMEDYLRVLKDGGMINLYRWAFPRMPREELRLHAIALAALKSIGAKNPWDHIIIGLHTWSLFLIKKTPFTDKERETIYDYLKQHDVLRVYPILPEVKKQKSPLNVFDDYVDYFKTDDQKAFERSYPYDISVITDDNPFFYKYYKINSFDPFHTLFAHHTGPIIFLTQALILLQAVIFITLFILFPLLMAQKQGLERIPSKSLKPFIIFFACLGTGFMFIEISLMQRFVLLLGSPIYSLSVVLAVLLVSTGVGSLAVRSLDRIKPSSEPPLIYVTLLLVIYLGILIFAGTRIYDFFMHYSFFVRVLLVSGVLFPIGLLLGTFFPSGLRLIGRDHQDVIAWAWGINCGFSVLGSILSIIIAQFLGFNVVMAMACALYLLAILSFRKLAKTTL
jgi:hypothetical protein